MHAVRAQFPADQGASITTGDFIWDLGCIPGDWSCQCLQLQCGYGDVLIIYIYNYTCRLYLGSADGIPIAAADVI
jgi:hypothetical protein